MAHLEKYKATSVGHMLAHYRRDPSSLERENIDPARVGMDYTLALDPADGLVKPMEGVDDHKGAQTRFSGLGSRLRGRR